MKRNGLAVVLVALLGAVVAGPSADAYGREAKVTARSATSSAPLPNRQRARLKAAVVHGLRDAATPGIVVGVQTPEGRWVKALGTANQGSLRAIRATMHHRIGSVTKTFMGTLLMQLAGDHELSLGDTIDQYVAGVPNGDTITLRQLADMTSGVASYTANPEFSEALYANPEQRWRPSELLEFGFADSPEFPPGTAFQYSDSNYILLGLAIQQAAGKPLRAVLRERIIDPLDLGATSWPGGSIAVPRPHARGYTLQGQPADDPADATNWNPSYAWAAGEMISTVDDLLAYGRALGTGEGLLAPRQQKRRLASFGDIPPLSRQLSYGIGLVEDQGWLGHTGQVPGFTTAVYHHPGIDTTVVVEANSDILSGDCPGQQTLTDDPFDGSCALTADRIMGAVAGALGRPYDLPPG
jgi:D-alanyl-D-alanine carboxypeptidase